MTPPAERPPLDVEDVAKRTTTAALRAWRVLHEVRENLGLLDEVRNAHHLGAGVLQGLRAELDAWRIEPMTPPPDTRITPPRP